jgi:predicted nucleic acid-binding protein
MAQVVVADASVLIALAQIGQLSLLQRLYAEVVIPPAVQSEVAPSVPTLPPWIHTHTLQLPLDSRVTHAALDAGETEAISLALETRAQWVILDDLQARRLAKDLGLAVVRLEPRCGPSMVVRSAIVAEPLAWAPGRRRRQQRQ